MSEQKSKEDKNFRHLVRIVNTDLDGNKKIGIALTKIKGVSFQFANAVCNINDIDKSVQSGKLADSDIKKLEDSIKNPINSGLPVWMLNRRKDMEDGTDKHILMGDLDFIQDNDVKILKKIKSYRGYRHAFGLPTRGQRTKSNFRRNKGKVQGVKKRAGAKAGK